MAKLNVNGKTVEIDVEEDTPPAMGDPRDHIGLTGTKYGCGVAQCGACTVHIDGGGDAFLRSATPMPVTEDQKIDTIEGLGAEKPHPVQRAWAEIDVAQCGYCQVGMMMAASALLAQNPNPSEAEIRAEITNICRCGTLPARAGGRKAAGG